MEIPENLLNEGARLKKLVDQLNEIGKKKAEFAHRQMFEVASGAREQEKPLKEKLFQILARGLK